MSYPEFEKAGIKLSEGIAPEKVYPICSLCNLDDVREMASLLASYGIKLDNLGVQSFRLFALNQKEVKDRGIESALEKMMELNLTEIFQANLNVYSLTPAIVARAEFCLKNQIPFVHQETNYLISEIYNDEAFAKYTTRFKPSSELVTADKVDSVTNEPSYVQNNIELDEEDKEVRTQIARTLLELKAENADPTFDLCLMQALGNLDAAIKYDNKAYRELGIRHIVDYAFGDMNLLPEMKEKIDLAFLEETQKEEMGK